MKHFLLAMATLWCVAGTFSLFAADNNKWKPLFGKNLENANYNPEVWSETDGVLGAVKDESIWTKDEYENFELDLDFKTDVGTNSGVVVYCTDTKDWIPNSVEIQISLPSGFLVPEVHLLISISVTFFPLRITMICCPEHLIRI